MDAQPHTRTDHGFRVAGRINGDEPVVIEGHEFERLFRESRGICGHETPGGDWVLPSEATVTVEFKP